jgi:uncharacterized protein YegP (UPF0339 family)
MKFEIKYNAAGEFFWHLVASNGNIICVSEGYVRKADALHSVESVKNNAMEAEVADRTRMVKGSY